VERDDRSGTIVSRTFFITQLAAISLDGLAAAAADVSAGDYFHGILLIAGIAAMVGVVWGFHLPAIFARRFSPRALSLGATLYSVFAVVLSYDSASGFGGLPDDLLARPSMQILRLGGTLALGAFALALLANLIAAAVALRSPKQPGD